MQTPLFTASPGAAATWEEKVAQRALDDLFQQARHYRASLDYWEMMQFIARFRFYSPYNAMLVYAQRPGARFVAPAHRWRGQYQREIKPGALPIVILQPMGPVMFVFDVSDTEPMKDAPPLPPAVTDPFGVQGRKINSELARTIENARRDGVRVTEQAGGSQSAGKISQAQSGKWLTFSVKRQKETVEVHVPLRYELLFNAAHTPETRYATLAHELGHLYCGHLGTPNGQWWPSRPWLKTEECEFEAESVCYLVCGRLGLHNPSAEYLSGYLDRHQEVPNISLECVVKAAGLIEQMGRGRLAPRKEK